MDHVFFKMVNKIDDRNLIPQVDTKGGALDHQMFEKSDCFLSAFSMRQLVYFDDLREYSAMSEVYRITGYSRVENSSFPAPSLWLQGKGIDLFWDVYTSETGCTRRSLNGHDVWTVQRKLVRSLR